MNRLLGSVLNWRAPGVVFLVSAASWAAPLPPADKRPVEFATDVEPLLAQRCYGCHGARQQMSGLRLDDRESAMKGGNSGAVLKTGDSAASPLIQRVAGAPGLMRMPPSGAALTPAQVGILRAWIDQGLVYPKSAVKATAAQTRSSSFWSLVPLAAPTAPRVLNRAWVRNPIDAFVLDRLERERIEPSAEAGRRTLLRRLSLDLTGLPPAPAEVEAFLSDNRPDAYERQVDRLLASPHYGEKWARFWLDLARYADSDGYEKDWSRPNAWRYREWVIDAFNADLPFDRFTVEQIAGDLLPAPTVEQRVATGFHRNTLTNREGGVDNEQFRFENVVDRASTVGTVWMGLTVGCAQCHDHKFDPIRQTDFYRMAAFFDNVEEVDIDAPLAGEIGPWLRTHDEYRKKRQALLDEYHVPELEKAWETAVMDAGDHPGKHTDLDLAWDVLLKLCVGGDGEKIIRKRPETRTEREQDVLINHFVRYYGFAVSPARFKELKFKELDEKLGKLVAAYPQLTQASVVAEAAVPRKSYLRVRGNYKALGIEVRPGIPEVLGTLPTERPNRLDLARWLVSGKNPLTARVMANRFWQELFGQGLVRTSEDFGKQGERPSHPELLDWLAAEYMEGGWSTKRLIRTMVLSATYRQASEERPELKSRDPLNTLLARQARLRLPAELVRDEALEAGGLLDPRVGGASVKPPQPKGVAELAYANSVKWEESPGQDRYRRGLYIHFQRSTPYPLLVNFDAPKAMAPECRRSRSNSPLQALNLLNDPAFVEAARGLAFRTAREGGDEFAGRLRTAYRLTLSRDPSPGETARLMQFFERQKGIFLQEPQSAAALGASAEEAAWVTLASVLLNLDEFITRE